jgi:hypothetical protein
MSNVAPDQQRFAHHFQDGIQAGAWSRMDPKCQIEHQSIFLGAQRVSVKRAKPPGQPARAGSFVGVVVTQATNYIRVLGPGGGPGGIGDPSVLAAGPEDMRTPRVR